MIPSNHATGSATSVTMEKLNRLKTKKPQQQLGTAVVAVRYLVNNECSPSAHSPLKSFNKIKCCKLTRKPDFIKIISEISPPFSMQLQPIAAILHKSGY